jgi:peroxiredoxin
MVATPVRPRLRVQVAVLAAAALVSVAGAIVWSRTVADGGPTAADDVVMDEPGEYVQPGAVTQPPVAADSLPAVELESVAGEPVRLRSDGRPMVVNLWYSTCPPCARELADFADVHGELGDEVRFVGVDPYDTVEAMVRFAADRGVTYELLRDPGFEFTDALGVVAFPVTLLVGADGRIVGQHGPIDDGELRAAIERHWGIA